MAEPPKPQQTVYTDTELERLKEIDAVLADILKKRQEINGETEKAVKAIKDQDKEIKKAGLKFLNPNEAAAFLNRPTAPPQLKTSGGELFRK